MNASSIMIPISDCPRVAEHRTIFDAVVMLEAWRRRSHEADYRLRVVLVYDDNHMIVGNLRAHGILHALSLLQSDADKTDHPADHVKKADTSSVFDRESLLWTDILTHLHEASHRMTVKDAMYHYHEAEYIDEHASIEEILSRLLSGPYLDLVVTSGKTAKGIVRLSDVFSLVCKYIEKSGMK